MKLEDLRKEFHLKEGEGKARGGFKFSISNNDIIMSEEYSNLSDESKQVLSDWAILTRKSYEFIVNKAWSEGLKKKGLTLKKEAREKGKEYIIRIYGEDKFYQMEEELKTGKVKKTEEPEEEVKEEESIDSVSQDISKVKTTESSSVDRKQDSEEDIQEGLPEEPQKTATGRLKSAEVASDMEITEESLKDEFDVIDEEFDKNQIEAQRQKESEGIDKENGDETSEKTDKESEDEFLKEFGNGVEEEPEEETEEGFLDELIKDLDDDDEFEETMDILMDDEDDLKQGE